MGQELRQEKTNRKTMFTVSVVLEIEPLDGEYEPRDIPADLFLEIVDKSSVVHIVGPVE